MPDAESNKKFRSPPYPSLALPKAIERAQQLYAKAQHHDVSHVVLADAWSYGAKSSGLWATAAALLHYGLLNDDGTGKGRKFKLTDAAHRIILDAEPNSTKRRETIQRAALKPMIHAELWAKYKDAKGLSDAVLKNYLMLDRRDAGQAPYSDGAADEVVRIYRDTVAFAGLADSGIVSPGEQGTVPEESGGRTDQTDQPAIVGDYVQWTSGGSDQFKRPRRVAWVSDDKRFLRVEGNPTGIPMSEVNVANPPSPLALGQPSGRGSEPPGTAGHSPINIYLTGNRLEIAASVDAEGLVKLKKMLDKYEDILKLLVP